MQFALARRHTVVVGLLLMPAISLAQAGVLSFTLDTGAVLVEQLEVLVDGSVATPVDGAFTTTAGTHQVEVRGANILPSQATLKLRAGAKGRTPLKVAVIALQRVVVVSTPSGAEVLVNDAWRGVTPCELRLAPGAYGVAGKLPGHLEQRVQVTVAQGRMNAVNLTLTAEVIAVAIESTPPGAVAVVDGTKRGVTPFTIKLEVGEHRLSFVKDGVQTPEERRTLASGEPPTWHVAIKGLTSNLIAPPLVAADVGTVSKVAPAPVAAPTKPEPTPAPVLAPKPEPTPAPAAAPKPEPATTLTEEAALPLLADPAVDVQRKREFIKARAATQADVSALVGATQPAQIRGEFCVEYAKQVRLVRISAHLHDAFGNAKSGVLFVHGVKYGQLPFEGMVPWCADVLEAAETEHSARVEWKRVGEFDTRLATPVRFVLPGQQGRVSVSALAETAFAVTPFPAALDADIADLSWAAGARLDYWGKMLHFSVAAKASSLFRRGMLGDGSIPVAPSGDVMVGLGFATRGEAPRVRVTLDVGVWSLVCPSVRISGALSLNERFFITATADGHLLLPVLVRDPQGKLSKRTLGDNLLFGGSLAVGVGW